MKLSLLLTAALTSVTSAVKTSEKKTVRRGLQSFKPDPTTCSDFEGRWEAIDGDDYSNLLVSIICDGDTATVRYSDDKWKAPTCGKKRGGGPGGFITDYTLNSTATSSSIDYDGSPLFNITCQDGSAPQLDFGDNQFVLQDNDSLKWFDFYNFWRVSDNN